MPKLEIQTIRLPTGRIIYTLLAESKEVQDFTYKHYRDDDIEFSARQVFSAEEAIEDIKREMKKASH